jgi:hypothetical protein
MVTLQAFAEEFADNSVKIVVHDARDAREVTSSVGRHRRGERAVESKGNREQLLVLSQLGYQTE